ncbi:MAG: flagellin lysine-N-methylase [Clostridia bacterium]|nr:flagellin lysine-N-methylase [Clostridia bacterium]
METHTFLMPDYYMNFSCKMGACRSACCVGWPISISMKNYFRLLGLDCNEDLRRRLDCGVRVVDRPTEEKYARFEPRYDGNCPLRMQDGRCAIHAELGEEILPDVCRLYPRGIRWEDGLYECSCANSCEAVLELMLEKEEPIAFVRRELTVEMPPLPERRSFFETLGVEQNVRLYLISIIQDRGMPLSQRIMCLGQVLDDMDVAFERKDKAMLDHILARRHRDWLTLAHIDEIREEHLAFGLDMVEQMIAILDERSESIRGYGEAALAYFGSGDGALRRYHTARSRFEALAPNWETFYEHMLVNHMFFSVFPFQDRPKSMHSEYVALCAVYAILRFLGLGITAEHPNKSGLIDGMAAAFRLIDHTEFDRLAAHLMQRLDCTSPLRLCHLISL